MKMAKVCCYDSDIILECVYLANMALLTLLNTSCKAKPMVLNDQQQANYTSMTAALFSSPGPWHLNIAQRYT